MRKALYPALPISSGTFFKAAQESTIYLGARVFFFKVAQKPTRFGWREFHERKNPAGETLGGSKIRRRIELYDFFIVEAAPGK